MSVSSNETFMWTVYCDNQVLKEPKTTSVQSDVNNAGNLVDKGLLPMEVMYGVLDVLQELSRTSALSDSLLWVC